MGTRVMKWSWTLRVTGVGSWIGRARLLQATLKIFTGLGPGWRMDLVSTYWVRIAVNCFYIIDRSAVIIKKMRLQCRSIAEFIYYIVYYNFRGFPQEGFAALCFPLQSDPIICIVLKCVECSETHAIFFIRFLFVTMLWLWNIFCWECSETDAKF